MITKAGIVGGAAIAAFMATTALTSVASAASIPSSPAEQAVTAELNRKVTIGNAAADDRYNLLQAQYLERKRRNDALHLQYQSDLQRFRDDSE